MLPSRSSQTYGEPAVYFYDVGYHCDHWCPLTTFEQCDDAESLCGSDILNATFANHTVVDKLPVDTWVWNDTAIFGSAQNALYFLSDTSAPYFRTDYANLVGKFENITQKYGGFKAGLPSDNGWFNVPDAQYCPQGGDDDCSQLKKVGKFKYLAMLRERKLAKKL